ncbi:XRE family transcriptional regulator [Streptococcus suis]|uniref:XRE family transcriptional regulator n=1 Tax=Streptococcus suis TaxID=1307 RepID=UPI001C98C112|nr:XRE family transcriptional regulator [Streptococcus suis]MBY4962988.1 XRE family transcriptional regulator [Streptococcus suis]MBY4969316.1 XRE family transcriptional regulator [Streptococcus suis]MBY4980424.1 XRE family transcriptional regulator [Streptococcus suis]MBY4988966.1 XRE family transcriptional regulator [Streptococcus suis]MBY4995539.1 XRE family transcriptional regulator [Streptococcus suis]
MNEKELAIYIGQQIKNYRKQIGLTQKELAEKLGMGHTTVANYEKGFRSPKKDTLFDLADVFGVSIDDLFPQRATTAPNSLVEQISDKVVQLTEPNQKNVLRYSSELLDKQNTVNEPQAIYFTYNYYDQPASAGTGQYLNDVKVETIELPIEVDADFVVPIYGDSMEPEYHSGDYIFVKLSVDLSDGDIGVFAYNGDAYIKQLRITDQGAYLHSLNPDYDNIQITADTDFRTIGEVVEVYRER